jgi:hypothetical protein
MRCSSLHSDVFNELLDLDCFLVFAKTVFIIGAALLALLLLLLLKLSSASVSDLLLVWWWWVSERSMSDLERCSTSLARRLASCIFAVVD